MNANTVLSSSPAFFTVSTIFLTLRSTPCRAARPQPYRFVIFLRCCGVSSGWARMKDGLSATSTSLKDGPCGRTASRYSFRSRRSGTARPPHRPPLSWPVSVCGARLSTCMYTGCFFGISRPSRSRALRVITRVTYSPGFLPKCFALPFADTS